ncbi:MAG: hypothetical protein MJZ16_02915 [Bacteroidales bacterium]|nr:hypothetical protein [Bacteroidales bacterium]
MKKEYIPLDVEVLLVSSEEGFMAASAKLGENIDPIEVTVKGFEDQEHFATGFGDTFIF